MKKIFGVLVAVALVFAFCGSALAADKMLGKFTVKTADGAAFDQEKIKGKKVTFVFSQMACRQCRTEMDELNAMADEVKGKLYVVLVDMNEEAAMKAYNSKYKMDVLLDPNFSLPDMFGFTSTPGTVVIDEKGKVIFEKTGYTRGDIDELKKFM